MRARRPIARRADREQIWFAIVVGISDFCLVMLPWGKRERRHTRKRLIRGSAVARLIEHAHDGAR